MNNKTNRKKSALRRLCLPLVLLALLTTLAACGEKPPASPEPQGIRTETVSRQAAGGGTAWSGNLVPAETAKLSFKVAGVIDEVTVNAGDAVTAGQMLARLKSSDYEIQTQAAHAQWQAAVLQEQNLIPTKISQAKAQLDLTRADFERVQSLYEAGAAPAADREAIAAKLTVDQATYQQALDTASIGHTETERALAAYDLAASNLAATKIVSPWDGIVLQQVAAAGELAAAGYPVLAVGKTREMWAEIGVTDTEASLLQPGLDAAVYVYGLEESRPGTVEEIGALADSLTRNFTVRVKLDNADGRLKAGMVAQVSIVFSGGDRILAPISSIIHLTTGDVVYVFDEAAGVARRRDVTTGEITGERVEVLSGLEPAEQLIVEGQFKLRDGDAVTAL
jgi:RND family efflux transporter MFP subunit